MRFGAAGASDALTFTVLYRVLIGVCCRQWVRRVAQWRSNWEARIPTEAP